MFKAMKNGKTWQVLDTVTRVWYTPKEKGKQAAEQMAYNLNK